MSSPFFWQSLLAYGKYTTFTPTGTWTTNTTYTGNWFRLGENMFLNYKVALAGAPTATILILNMPLVGGVTATIDTSKLLQSGNPARSAIFSSISISDANGPFFVGSVTINDATSFTISTLVTTGTTFISRTAVNATNPITFASGDDITIQAAVPISGWSV